MNFLVTTDIQDLPHGPIVMVDGTVPHWEPIPGIDFHWDHHRPGGAPIQMDEIPLEEIESGKIKIPINATIVTTMVDADACVAAAAVRLAAFYHLSGSKKLRAMRKFRAIAWDCDHLALPPDPEWDDLREFAAKAVAALKQSGKAIAQELRLPSDRKDWSAADKTRYASTCFERGTDALVLAALEYGPWPGENGEADAYFEEMESQWPDVKKSCYMAGKIAVFDSRGFEGKYVDPRLPVRWVSQYSTKPLALLTVRDGSRQPNQPKGAIGATYSYTLGKAPGTDPQFSSRGVWEKLSEAENSRRASLEIPPLETEWGGREAVGGSSWHDAMITPPWDLANDIVRAMDPWIG